MEAKQLILLKKEYNAALARFIKMCKWIETASEEDQLKNYKYVVEVINNCKRLINEIKTLDPLVAPTEIMNGFKGV